MGAPRTWHSVCLRIRREKDEANDAILHPFRKPLSVEVSVQRMRRKPSEDAIVAEETDDIFLALMLRRRVGNAACGFEREQDFWLYTQNPKETVTRIRKAAVEACQAIRGQADDLIVLSVRATEETTRGGA